MRLSLKYHSIFAKIMKKYRARLDKINSNIYKCKWENVVPVYLKLVYSLSLWRGNHPEIFVLCFQNISLHITVFVTHRPLTFSHFFCIRYLEYTPEFCNTQTKWLVCCWSWMVSKWNEIGTVYPRMISNLNSANHSRTYYTSYGVRWNRWYGFEIYSFIYLSSLIIPCL